jgi:hypothetical protein
MNLEQMLVHLTSFTDSARAQWIAETYEDGYEPDGELWLTLEESRHGDGRWHCGWRVQEDEASEWAMKADGYTPVKAAQALLNMFAR